MKRILPVLLAVMLVLGVAGQASASFEAGNLIAVFYNGTDNEVAMDLGAVIPGSTVTADTSSLMGYFSDPALTYEDISVGIFAAEAGYSNWFATTDNAQPAISTSSITSFGDTAGTLYTIFGGLDLDNDGIAVQSAGSTTSYNTKMNSGGTAGGYYAGFNPDIAIGETELDAAGNFMMYVHNFDIATYDAPAMVEVTTVPVPAAVWLLGSGLIGLVGIRRKKA